jgi:hypothetical protein
VLFWLIKAKTKARHTSNLCVTANFVDSIKRWQIDLHAADLTPSNNKSTRKG